ALSLAGLGAILISLRSVQIRTGCAVPLAAVIAIAAALKLVALALRIAIPVDHFLFRAESRMNPMPPNTALCLVLQGASAMTIPSRILWHVVVGQACAIGAGLIGVIALMGYAVGILGLHSSEWDFPMAVNTATIVPVLAVAFLTANPNRGAMNA